MKKTILLMAALSLVALQACKEEENTPVSNVVDSGTCGAQGSNLTWTLKNDGTLTIAGNGTMEDYDYETVPSWADYQDYISAVVIQDGVTSIGESAFSGCRSLSLVTIPEGVISIGSQAFDYCTSLARIVVKAQIPPALGFRIVVDASIPVYVPASSIEAYRNGEWGQYFNNIQPISY